ncbi:hypothetical protein GCM10023238_30030 [Streptomyces heliomycini]
MGLRPRRFVAVPLTVPASYDTPSAALTKLEGIWRMLGGPDRVLRPDREAGLRAPRRRQNWTGPRLTRPTSARGAEDATGTPPSRTTTSC